MSTPNLKRKVINAVNAMVLSRINGSVVVSGYPKTGTTYMSHVVSNATGLRYLEGSQELALRRAVVHCHFRAVPHTALFCYRPLGQVVPSFVAHDLAYDRHDVVERLEAHTETPQDQSVVSADALSESRRQQGDGFYRRPSQRVATLLASDTKISAQMNEMAARIAARVEGQAA